MIPSIVRNVELAFILHFRNIASISGPALREFKRFNGIAYFKPHESSKIVEISSIEDDVPEPDKDFIIRIVDVVDETDILDQAVVDHRNDSFVFKGM